MATQADLRRLVLAHLTVIDPNDDIEADQASLLNRFIDGSTAQLKERGLCWWDDDEIPAEVTMPLMRYVAAMACSAFGKRGKGFEADLIPDRRDIAAHTRSIPTPIPIIAGRASRGSASGPG